MFRLVKDEALAYLKLGLVSGNKNKVPHRHRSGRYGVLFVPGVGANASQFLPLKETLREEADWFDSFEYFSLRRPQSVAAELRAHLEERLAECEQLLLVGHSLGGFLLRVVLQMTPHLPPGVAGYVSICAPLHGTWRSKLAPSPGLRDLTPDSKLMQMVHAQSDRLAPLAKRTLTIGVEKDQFISPADSAFLEGSQQLMLPDVAHAGSLLDTRVHREILKLMNQIKSESAQREI